MCTVSGIRHDAGYELFFNRDEKLTRKKALPPCLAERDGVRFLAPVDGDSGGAWIAANEFGISICLLNGANLTGATGANSGAKSSRGLVIPALMASRSVTEVRLGVEEADFTPFAAFTLAAMGPAQPAVLLEWDGMRKTLRLQDEPYLMLTSSSFDPDAVRASRQRDFRSLLDSCGRIDSGLLEAFHKSHAPARSAYSVCMHRGDAETVSYSRIRVSSREVDFLYSPAAPCCGSPGVVSSLG